MIFLCCSDIIETVILEMILRVDLQVHSFLLKWVRNRTGTGKRRKEVVDLTKREEYEAKAEKMLTPLMEENHFELVDVEYVKEAGTWYLRAYVDKEGGITINDCEMINRAWSDMMDKEDFIPEAYVLEVSSPGLGRQLKKEKDFSRSLGQSVDVKFYQGRKLPLGKNKKEVSVKELTGILKAYTQDTITLETEFDPDYIIPRSEISTVKLTIDF